MFGIDELFPYIETRQLKKYYKNLKAKEDDEFFTVILKSLAYVGRIAEEILKKRLEPKADVLMMMIHPLNIVNMSLNMISGKVAYDTFNQIKNLLESDTNVDESLEKMMKILMSQIEKMKT